MSEPFQKHTYVLETENDHTPYDLLHAMKTHLETLEREHDALDHAYDAVQKPDLFEQTIVKMLLITIQETKSTQWGRIESLQSLYDQLSTQLQEEEKHETR